MNGLSGVQESPSSRPYRGRLARSPTGYLHLGHAHTFWIAQVRAQAAGGVLVLRNEDLHPERCRPEFVTAMLEDLRWFGLEWQEGPDRDGPHRPYAQSRRTALYREALGRLLAGGYVYPCSCSRKDIRVAAAAPQGVDDELIYPGTCRPENLVGTGTAHRPRPRPPCWRFRVPDGALIEFGDGCFGDQRFVAGRDVRDFVVWRPDDVPAYQLACGVDDAAMGITEVVRGADLLVSTARQLLLYRALGLSPPAFYHRRLVTDAKSRRLAKRHDAPSLRALRAQGRTPEQIRSGWTGESGASFRGPFAAMESNCQGTSGG